MEIRDKIKFVPVLVYDDGETTHRTSLRGGLTLGRSSDNDIVLRDFSVSRHHAEVDEIDGIFKIRDLNSTNGVKVNDTFVTVANISPGDLVTIGGNHFIHAARRNIDLKILCVNNFNYGMTGGQVAPTTPVMARTTTSPFGNHEHPFNLPHMAHASGAVYVARWTAFHARQLVVSIAEIMNKKGFSFIEVIAPCPIGYGRPNKLGDGLEEMKYYREMSVIKDGADPAEAGIDLKSEIIVGKFIDKDKPTFSEQYQPLVERTRGKGKK